MKDNKPWTWEELREINLKRGPKYVEFLKEYGMVGAVALELSHIERVQTFPLSCALHDVMDVRGRRIFGGRKICNNKCPFYSLSCMSWHEEGRRVLEEWYVKHINDQRREENGYGFD